MIIPQITFYKRKTSKSASTIAWTLLILALVTIALTKENFLPEHFFYDANTIADFMRIKAQLSTSNSFSSTAALYQTIGAKHDSLIFSLLSATLLILIFITYIGATGQRTISALAFATIIFTSSLSTIFMSMLSKDLIALAVIAPCLLLLRKSFIPWIIWLSLAIMYAYFFRNYWALFIIQLFATIGFAKKFKNPTLFFAMCIISIFILSIAFRILLNIDLDHYRLVVNDLRINGMVQDARTMITPFVKGGGVAISWTNTTLTWLTLMVPIPLLLTFELYYIVIFICITTLFSLFWTSFISNFHKERDTKIFGSIVTAFTLIQSIFEPDYGSFIRHLAPMYPLMIYVILKNKTLHSLTYSRLQ